MGDDPDPNAETKLGPAEDETRVVPPVVAQTQPSIAWSDDDDYEDDPRPRRSWAGWLTAAAVTASIVASLGAAAMTMHYFLTRHAEPSSAPSPSMVQAAPPSTITTTPVAIAAPPPPIAAPTVTIREAVPAAPPAGRPLPQPHPGAFTSFVSWIGTDCIDVRMPDDARMPLTTTCASNHVAFVHHTTLYRGQLVGADPIMGSATMLACKVVDDSTNSVIAYDEGILNDGHDVNCIVGAP